MLELILNVVDSSSKNFNENIGNMNIRVLKGIMQYTIEVNNLEIKGNSVIREVDQFGLTS